MKYIEPSLPFVDLFLADLKHVDEAVFQQWTDGSARRCWITAASGAGGEKMIIRVPLIQGFNASEADIAAITDFAADRLQVSEIHYLPYHTLGMNKYQLLSQPTPHRTNRWTLLSCSPSRRIMRKARG